MISVGIISSRRRCPNVCFMASVASMTCIVTVKLFPSNCLTFVDQSAEDEPSEGGTRGWETVNRDSLKDNYSNRGRSVTVSPSYKTQLNKSSSWCIYTGPGLAGKQGDFKCADKSVSVGPPVTPLWIQNESLSVCFLIRCSCFQLLARLVSTDHNEEEFWSGRRGEATKTRRNVFDVEAGKRA